MRPNRKDGIIIATADEATYKWADHAHWHANGPTFYDDEHKDTEIVWYSKTRSLCIQSHPEYHPDSHHAEYCRKLVEEFYFKTVHEISNSTVLI